MHDRDERGFTIVELMIVVAIIAVLAAVVVPSFVKESTRSKAKTEVHAMFAELGTREENYKTEGTQYMSAAACPASANAQGTDMTTAACTTGTDWTALRVTPTESKLTCSYTVTAGLSSTDPVPLTEAWVQASTPTLKTPAVSWYFIHAVCPNTEYFTASWDSKIRSKDGK